MKAGEEKFIKRMLLSSLNLSHQKIADCMEVSLERVEEIAKSIKK